MAREDEPTPQEQGQRIPPSRRPPIALAVDAPEPPKKSFIHRIVQRIAALFRRKIRPA
jgi:hypothetical protein